MDNIVKVEMNKVCRGACGRLKLLSGFPKNRNRADGHDNECKDCKNARNRARYSDGPGLDYQLQRKYGITIQEYHKMYASQDGRCGVCSRNTDEKGAPLTLVVDHNHETGKVRGLLCSPCNTAEGLLGGSPHRALNLMRYIMSDGAVKGVSRK